MNEAVIIVSSLAIIFSTLALIMGCVAISMVSGFLRSTHTIAWKPLETPVEELEEEDDRPHVHKLPKQPKTDYAFMDDVADLNNF